MSISLYDWGPSPFCLKVRAILDYKGLEYRRIPVLGSPMISLLRRSTVRKVPVLDIDGEIVIDSTDIAYTLERLVPTPTIVPTEPRQRALSSALEDWADEALYFTGLYFQWLDPEGAPMVATAFGNSPVGRLAYWFYRRRIRQQVRGQGTGRKPPQMIENDLARQLSAIDGLLEASPFLLGKEPYLADFGVMSQLVYLSRPPRSLRMLAQFPRLGEYLERMKSLRAA